MYRNNRFGARCDHRFDLFRVNGKAHWINIDKDRTGASVIYGRDGCNEGMRGGDYFIATTYADSQ